MQLSQMKSYDETWMQLSTIARSFEANSLGQGRYHTVLTVLM